MSSQYPTIYDNIVEAAKKIANNTALIVDNGGGGGGGGVSGPGSSTNTAIALWNGTLGSALMNSKATIDSSGNIVTPGNLTVASLIPSTIVWGSNIVPAANLATATTQAASDSSTNIATTAFVHSVILNYAIKAPVEAATAGVLPFTPTYANGALGVGATLTGTVGVLVVDTSYTPVLGDRILVKNQATTYQNGVYTLTTLGTVGVGYVLTRATDFNQTSNILYGDTVAVLNGSVNVNQQFTMNNNAAITVGTTAVTFAQTSGASQLTSTGGTIGITGNNIDVVTATSTQLGAVKPDNSSVINTSGVLTVTPTSIGLGNVTNDVQTKAAVVPNTAPSAGNILVGNAGGTAYAPVAASADATISSAGAVSVNQLHAAAMYTKATDSVTTSGNAGFLLPVILYVKSLTLTTTGGATDLGYITVPASITRWVVAGARTDASNSYAVAESASGTLVASVLAFYTAANAGGTTITTGLTLSNCTAANKETALAMTITAGQTYGSLGSTGSANTIYIHQTTNSANAGTISVYIEIIPLP